MDAAALSVRLKISLPKARESRKGQIVVHSGTEMNPEAWFYGTITVEYGPHYGVFDTSRDDWVFEYVRDKEGHAATVGKPTAKLADRLARDIKEYGIEQFNDVVRAAMGRKGPIHERLDAVDMGDHWKINDYDYGRWSITIPKGSR